MLLCIVLGVYQTNLEIKLQPVEKLGQGGGWKDWKSTEGGVTVTYVCMGVYSKKKSLSFLESEEEKKNCPP